MRPGLTALALLPLLASCTDHSSPASDAAAIDSPAVTVDAAADAAVVDAAVADAANPCPRPPAPADRARKIVISRPYDAAGNPAQVYEVLDLSATGDLSRPGVTFSMGRATAGEIVFTPDGEVGLLPLEDGTLGVFRWDETGAPVVVHAAFAGTFYAGRVVMDPGGARAYVLDSEWDDIGGGVYSVAIGCDGSLTDEGRLLAAKLPYALALLDGGRALLAGQSLPGAAAGDDVNLIALGAAPERIASADAWGDDDAIVADGRGTSDGRYLLLADNNSFSGTGGRLAAVEILESGLRPAQVLSLRPTYADPAVLVMSPFGDTALVLGCMDDAILALDYAPASTDQPFSLRGEIAYHAGDPAALPCGASLIDRGPLRGRVLVAENAAIRQIDLQAGGAIVDHGLLRLGVGDDLTAIVGALGVQP